MFILLSSDLSNYALLGWVALLGLSWMIHSNYLNSRIVNALLSMHEGPGESKAMISLEDTQAHEVKIFNISVIARDHNSRLTLTKVVKKENDIAAFCEMVIKGGKRCCCDELGQSTLKIASECVGKSSKLSFYFAGDSASVLGSNAHTVVSIGEDDRHEMFSEWEQIKVLSYSDMDDPLCPT